MTTDNTACTNLRWKAMKATIRMMLGWIGTCVVLYALVRLIFWIIGVEVI